MNGQQALAFTALNLPFGLAILLGMAMLAPLPTHWRLPGITLLLAGSALATLQLGQLAQSAGHLEPACTARAGDPLAGTSQNPACCPCPQLNLP